MSMPYYNAAPPILIVVILVLVLTITTTHAANLTVCDSRCGQGNRTQIFFQRSNGTCVRRCINRTVVPRGYGCGPCPVDNPSRYDTALAVTKVPQGLRSVFTNAAARWERVIVGDLPSSKIKNKIRVNSTCSPFVPKVIDDIFICASIIDFIDGPEGILGQTGTEWIRDDMNLPLIAYMEFDAADTELVVNQSIFDKVVMHEMGHAYGIDAYFWQEDNLQNNQTCQYALNSNATREWQNLTGCNTSIPVELGGGNGTICSHWSEDCLQEELMTGFAAGGMELSRMTVGTLQDLGYTVNYSGADAFDISKVNSSCIASCTNNNNITKRTRRRKLDGGGAPPSSADVFGINSDDDGNELYNRRPTATTTTRQLSEARLYAMDYGKMVLEKNAAKAPLPHSIFNRRKSGYTYVGDQMVRILYRESDGSIHSVEVRK